MFFVDLVYEYCGGGLARCKLIRSLEDIVNINLLSRGMFILHQINGALAVNVIFLQNLIAFVIRLTFFFAGPFNFICCGRDADCIVIRSSHAKNIGAELATIDLRFASESGFCNMRDVIGISYSRRLFKVTMIASDHGCRLLSSLFVITRGVDALPGLNHHFLHVVTRRRLHSWIIFQILLRICLTLLRLDGLLDMEGMSLPNTGTIFDHGKSCDFRCHINRTDQAVFPVALLSWNLTHYADVCLANGCNFDWFKAVLHALFFVIRNLVVPIGFDLTDRIE